MAVRVKPANLITTNRIISVSEIVSDLSKSVPKETSGPVKTYLELLIKLYISPENDTTQKIKDHFTKNRKEILPNLNAIKTDFGEILGGIATVNQNLLGKYYKVNFRSGKLEYPTAQNEPLKDYSVYVGNTEYIISAKVSGGTSNTVKPQDILQLIHNSRTMSPARKRELKGSLEYNVLEILGKEKTVKGPLMAMSYIRINIKYDKKRGINNIIDLNLYPTPGAGSVEIAKADSNINVGQKTSKPYEDKAYKKLLDSKYFKQYASGRGIGSPVTWADLVLFTEQIIEKMSKNKNLDFGQLFLDAINSQVHYVKITIDSMGIPKFEAKASVKIDGKQDISSFNTDNIFMRSKSSMYRDGRYRLKDKMGIQT